jgi:uncharacterized protein YqfA (UPF0365 family)
VNPPILLPLLAAGALPQGFAWCVLFFAVVFLLLVVLTIARSLGQWSRAISAGLKITPWELIGMRLRKVDSKVILHSWTAAFQAGVPLTLQQLEAHYLAGGRVPEVVRAVIAAHLSHIELSWNLAAAMDLAGKDVLHAVEKAIDARSAKVTFN